MRIINTIRDLILKDLRKKEVYKQDKPPSPEKKSPSSQEKADKVPAQEENVSIERRQFFRMALGFVGQKTEETVKKKLRVERRKHIRPPGAVDELSFLALCTRCDACIRACPHNSIKRAETRGINDGTPIIVPREKPCYLCKDFPCIKACKDGALKMVKSPEDVRMGTAVIDRELCLAWGGQFCEHCARSCPLGEKALFQENSKPIVRREGCTGCGICEQVCLTVNTACAIKIIPAG